MELPPRDKRGRKPTSKSSPYMREYWRRRYYMKKEKKAAEEAQNPQPITPEVEAVKLP